MAKKSKITYKDYITKDGLLLIEGWTRDGLDYQQIANNIGVSHGTFRNWVSMHSDIREAVKKGERPLVYEVENALINSALGFEYEETETIVEEKDGRPTTKIIRRKRRALPNLGAIAFYLKNKEPEKWRKVSVEYTEKNKADIKRIEKEMEKMDIEIALSKAQLENVEQDSRSVELRIVDDWNEDEIVHETIEIIEGEVE